MTPREAVNLELKLIERIFNERKVVHPMVVIIKGNKRTIIQPVEFHNDIHKDNLSQGVKDLVKKSNPDMVVYMAEAWAVFMPPEEYNPKTTPRPSEHPDRAEIVVARIEFKTGEKYQCDARIIREHGKARLGRFKVLPGGNDMGRFVDFFPVTRTN